MERNKKCLWCKAKLVGEQKKYCSEKCASKKYYVDNREIIISRSREYRDNHEEEISAKAKIFYQKNKEKIIKLVKQRYIKKERINTHCLLCGKLLEGQQRKFCSIRCNDKNKCIVHKEKIRQRRKNYYYSHKEELAKKAKQYYIDHKEEIAEYNKRYVIANKERKRAYKKQYYLVNKQKILQYRKNNREKLCRYHREKRKRDPILRLHRSVSESIRRCLKKNKGTKNSKKTFDILGYTAEELKKHLESTFVEGMDWGNYGHKGWQIDHVRPVSSFAKIEGIESPEFKELWSLENLSALFWWENVEKSDRLDWVRDSLEVIDRKVKKYLKKYIVK